ncbi:unannotated protein [freshwater metagenome]|uniref:Unannotated protein n=1 Tax=freshwater metagenome TaxID=449393 RepID=A0A6J7BWB0_9ZZZZ
MLEERTAFVVGGRGGDHRDVHASDAVDGVLIDLVEHRLLVETERVVAAAVELAGREAAEVTDAGKCNREETVEELPHAVAAQCHVGADGHSLAQLELGDRLAGLGDLGLLARDRREVLDRTFDELGVAGRLADTHVDHDLGQTGDLHDIAEGELLAECRDDLLEVARLEANLHLLGGRSGHQMSLPERFEMRTLREDSYDVPSGRVLVTTSRR